MRTDKRTDRRKKRRGDVTKLIFAFRNFANAPKMHSMGRKSNFLMLSLLVHIVTVRLKGSIVTCSRLKVMLIALSLSLQDPVCNKNILCKDDVVLRCVSMYRNLKSKAPSHYTGTRSHNPHSYPAAKPLNRSVQR
jgi:hypothetical protein